MATTENQGLWIETSALNARYSDDADALMRLLASKEVRSLDVDGLTLVRLADVEARLGAQTTATAPQVERETLHSATVKRQIQQANHLAQLGTMAMSIGHEINNPLSYVLFNNHFIREELLPKLKDTDASEASFQEAYDETEELLLEIEEGSNHIRRIVSEFSGLKRHAVEVTQMAAGEVLDTALRMVGPALNSSVTVKRDVTTHEAIWFNTSHLIQVLINLITNSVHAVQGVPSPYIAVNCREDSGKIVFEVEDNGGGIRPDLLDKVFDPFFTTKPIGEGTGLGLAVCRQLIEAMHGTLELSSTPDVGTLVRVTIPPMSEATQEDVEDNEDVQFQGVKLLIIDDQPAVIRTLTRMLAPLGMSISTETNPGRAINKILNENFDLFLCDLMMPNMTGMMIYRKLMNERPELCQRFVFMSGGPASEEARAFCAAHEDKLLGKPIELGHMKTLIASRLQTAKNTAGPCPNITMCPMFPRFQADHMLSVYKWTYCEPKDGTFRKCARYRSMKSGVRPSPNLLPHGEELPEL